MRAWWAFRLGAALIAAAYAADHVVGQALKESLATFSSPIRVSSVTASFGHPAGGGAAVAAPAAAGVVATSRRAVRRMDRGHLARNLDIDDSREVDDSSRSPC